MVEGVVRQWEEARGEGGKEEEEGEPLVKVLREVLERSKRGLENGRDGA